MLGGGSAQRAGAVAALITVVIAVPFPVTDAPQAAVTARPVYNHQAEWSLDALDAEWLWGVDQGAGVTVAIIDTGVQASDPDLAGTAIARVAAVPGAGSGGSHGTRIAEIIAGQGIPGDPDAIVGLAPRAELIDIPVTNDPAQVAGSEIAAGIQEAVRAKARIINVSLGVPQQGTQLAKAVADAIASGCLVVASISPGGQRAQYPADSNMVLSVAGVGKNLRPDGSLAEYGPRAVYAPDAGGPGASGDDIAAAYVSAAASLIWSVDPTLSVTDLRQGLYKDVTGTRGSPGGLGDVDPQGILTLLGFKPVTVTPSPSQTVTPPPSPSRPTARSSSSSKAFSGPGPGSGFSGLDWAFIGAGALLFAVTIGFIWRKSSNQGSPPLGPPGDWQSDLWR